MDTGFDIMTLNIVQARPPHPVIPTSLTHSVFFAYVKEEWKTSPTLECLLDPDMIEGFVRSLKGRQLIGSTIARYVDNLKYGLRYLYTKDGKAYAEQEHYVNLGRLGVQCRKQAVHSTAHHSWQALEAKHKWAEW